MFQPLFVRPVLSTERETLERCARSGNREEAGRAEIVLQSAGGKTATEISQSLGYHPSNVKKWIRRFNRDGIKGIVVKKRGPQGGPRPRFNAEQVTAIVELSKTSPDQFGLSFKAWTPQKLATTAVERGIVESISHVTVRQILKRYDSSIPRQSTSNQNGQSSVMRQRSGLTRLELGKEELARSAYEAAADHFCAALREREYTPEEEANIRAYLSESLEELSRYEEAHKVIEKYDDPQALAALTTHTRGKIKLRIGWVNSLLMNFPKAIASLNDAMKLFLELQDNLGVSESNYAIGHTYIRINEFRIARDYLLAAARSQRSIIDRDLLARIYDRLGAVDFYEGSFSSSKENYLKALELAEGSPNTNLLGRILLNLGTTCDEREAPVNYYTRAIEHLERGGHKDYLALAYNNLGENLRCVGRWDEACRSLNRAIEIASRYSSPQHEATARITLAELLVARGEYAEAESNVDKSLDLIEGTSDKWLQSRSLRILAMVQQGRGKTEAAHKTLRDVLALSTSIGDLNGVVLAQVALAEFHFMQGRHDQAREYLEFAHSRLKDEKTLTMSGLVQRMTGQLEAACGHLTEAKQHIAQSISIFTTTSIVYEEARSHYEMGILLKKAGDLKNAEASLLEALTIFDRLGASPSSVLARKALDTVRSGDDRYLETVRVQPPSDVLLMQRLIEASASRELLLQELAAVIHEYFSAQIVLVCRFDEGGRAQIQAVQGIDRFEGERICSSLGSGGVETYRKVGDEYTIRLADGERSFIIIYIRSDGMLDVGRLQPLLKQVELGLETCSLRAVARNSVVPSFEHRVQTIMPGFIVGSPAMFDVVEKIQKIRTSDVTVLITGESGTGKELIARAIHAESARARAIFLPFNCTATPKDIIDSQLFGHRRGAFTGATANYPGIIKAADGGTLFLDEIGDLALEVQPKLMRFLQEGEIQPLGETKPLRVDVRILAATNAELERAVADGRFREDLFHRLNIIRIHVPPLRERREEVPVLASHFLEHLSSRSGKQGLTLTQQALDALTTYDWPGNVRQLRNEIERAVAYSSEGAAIDAEDFSPEVARPRKRDLGARPDPLMAVVAPGREYGQQSPPSNGEREYGASSAGSHVKLKDATAALERKLIGEALMRNKHNLSRTALDLGLSRRGLRLKLAQLGLSKEGGAWPQN
jgi:DNA-binding NtrC family response regulator/tetratricopeptide (TPR) repeat protein